MFCNEIPIIETRGGCIVMKHPDVVQEIHVDRALSHNTTRYFVRNNVIVDVIATNVMSTQCSGLLCDKQRCIEISSGSRACGCYFMHTRVGMLALVHEISLSSEGDEFIRMPDFSSNRFSDLYLKDPFSPTVKYSKLNFTPEFFKLQDCIDNCVKYINNKGRFSVIGWYKSGQIMMFQMMRVKIRLN